MDKHICSLIERSKWLEVGAINFMKIKQSTPIHVAVERIYLNVAASHGTNWINVERANQNQTSLYAAKIVTALLIRSVLLYTYKMKDYEVNVFLGNEIVNAIDYYFANNKSKK